MEDNSQNMPPMQNPAPPQAPTLAPVQKKEQKLGQIMSVNLIVFCCYHIIPLILIAIIPAFPLFYFTFFVFLIHGAVLILSGIVRLLGGNAPVGSTYMLTGFMIIIIGFGSCTFMANNLFKGL